MGALYMKKIAILGGTFNPIHNGHIIGIQKVYDSQLFDEVWIMPSKIPPYKQQEVSSSKSRLEMCQLVANELAHTTVIDEEMKRDEISYTYDTLSQLKRSYPDTHFYWIIGYDNLSSIESWYKGVQLLTEFGVVVLNRGGYAASNATTLINDLQKRLKATIIEINMPDIEISSSDIRERIKEQKSIVGYVLPSIIKYINNNQLYQ